jgi:hypothetical protein
LPRAKPIATENGVNRKTVRLWRKRFSSGGPEALWEIAPGRGRKSRYDAARIKAIIDATLQTKPKGNTHWSCRTMAVAQGMGKSSVNRIWRSHNLKSHRAETFKLSRDPRFLEKLTDVVGLYLNPPDQAIVLCVDEKSGFDQQEIRRDSFLSVDELIAAINEFLAPGTTTPNRSSGRPPSTRS